MSSKSSMQAYYDLAKKDAIKLERQELIRSDKIHKSKKRLQIFEYLLEHLDISSLIAVHLTDHFPNNGIIKPYVHFPLDLYDNKVAKALIKGKDLRHCRSTLHFSLNRAVEGFVGGGQMHIWKSKYAILIPVKDIIQRLASLDPVDSWTIGVLTLPRSAEILVPQKEFNQKKSKFKSGKAKIIPYDNKQRVQEAANLRIQVKGYQYVTAGDRSWFEGADIQRVAEFIRKSEILSDQEKSRLIKIAQKKGFHYWARVVEALKEKYQKLEFSTHDMSFWRQIEKEIEKVFGDLFGAKDYELDETANYDFTNSLGSFWGVADYGVDHLIEQVVEYQKKHNNLHKDELTTLKELEDSLVRLDFWLKSLHKKVDQEIKMNKEITWKQIYQKIGLL